MHRVRTHRLPAKRLHRAGALAVAVLAITSSSAFAAEPVSIDFSASGDNAQGLFAVNQDGGDANNQSNVAVIAMTSGDHSAAIARAIADAERQTAANPTAQVVQHNAIQGSFDHFSGLAQVNQTTGQANVQANIIAVAFAPGASFSPGLTDVELHGVVAPQVSGAPSSAVTSSANSVSGSFNDFHGIAQVQQIAGDNNLVTNVVAIAVGAGG